MVFAAVLEQQPAERLSYLDQMCGSDTELRTAVLALLEADREAEGFLDDPLSCSSADWSSIMANLEALAPEMSSFAAAVPGVGVQAGAGVGRHSQRPKRAEPPVKIEPGELIDGTYLVEEYLGKGGMGIVFRVRHVHLGKSFALKVIDRELGPDSHALQRFEVEAKALGRLSHPNIVKVTDFGIDDQRRVPYLVMEHLQGRSMKQLEEAEGPLGLEQALPILKEIAAGLDYAHDMGILHRDLKPHNIFLADEADGSTRVKVLDFGVARFLAGLPEDLPLLTPPVLAEEGDADADARPAGEPSSKPDATSCYRPADDAPAGPPARRTAGDDQALTTALGPELVTETGAVVGTPAYLAPELVSLQPPTPSSDLYSFGVLIFEALVGRKPFLKKELADQLRAHLREQPPLPSQLNPQLAPELDEALLRLLSKRPQQRPGSAAAVVQLVGSAWRQSLDRAWRRRERPRRLAIAAGLALLAILVSLVLGRLQLVQDLEDYTIDTRFSLAKPRPPQDRLVVSVIDDSTLASDPEGKPLIAYHDEMAQVLEETFRAGVSGICIDIFMRPSWPSESELIFRFLVNHHDRLALAVHSSQNEQLVGARVAEGMLTLALGETAAADLFGWVNVKADRDGTVRRFALGFEDLQGRWFPTLCAKATALLTGRIPALPGHLDTGIIDYRIDRSRIPVISWQHLRATARQHPEKLAGRLLLVGANIEGVGHESFKVPCHGQEQPTGDCYTTGVMLHALMISTLLDGCPVRMASGWQLLLVLVFPSSFLLLWARRLAPAVLVSAGGVLILVVASFILFHTQAQLVPLVALTAGFVSTLALTAALRRSLPPRPGTAGSTISFDV